MKTVCYKKSDKAAIINALMSGKTVAFPTDTVYGLGVIYDKHALDALKRAKGRSEAKPIPTMVASYEQLTQIAELNDAAKKLIEAFMPGALTLVLKKKDHVPEFVTNGNDTIAVRMPKDSFVLSVIQGCGGPLLVSSANRSDEPNTYTAAEVLEQLDGKIDAIVCGNAGGKSASTIIDVSEAELKVLRIGEISEADIRKAIDNYKEEKQ